MPQALAKSLNQFSQGTLWLTILLTPFVALAGGLGFQATGCLLGISAILVWAIDRTEAAYLRAFWPLFLMAFMGWAWISSLWSGYKGDNAYLLAGLLVPLLFVPLAFLRVPPRARHPLILTVIAVSLLGIAMLVIDTASGFAISLLVDPVASGEDPVARRGDAEMNLGRGQISYLQLLWPVAGLLMLKFKRGWILTALCFLGLALSAYFNRVSIVFPTLFISVAVALLAWRNPRLGLGLAFFIAIASIVVSPLLGIVSGAVDQEMMRKIPLSWEHRLRMWAYSWELIKQAPLIGHGFDSAREFNQLTFRAPDGRDITVMSLHPHNIGLQIWLETGLVGVVLFAGFLVAMMKTIFKICTESIRAFAATGLIVTIATSGAVAIGVWQHWWWALIVLSASLISLIPPKMNAA